MARHSSGSRSGGRSSSSSRSRSGSRGGGSSGPSVVTSSKPFRGCYNRSYYDRRGVYHEFYTTDAEFGKKGPGLGITFATIFITVHMLLMLSALILMCFDFGNKVNGPESRIYIEDTANKLTVEEELWMMELFEKVYEQSGMPVALVTTDYKNLAHYASIEILSEELYYSKGFDEESMLILYTEDIKPDGFVDWHYDFCCGDITVNCLSDSLYDTLTGNFHKAMASGRLAYSLDYAFNSVIDDMGVTRFNGASLPVLPFLLAFYGVFYWIFLGGTKRQREAAKYFKANPEKFEERPMTIYAVCPACGASNSEGLEKCMYCDTLLKLTDGNTTFIRQKS